MWFYPTEVEDSEKKILGVAMVLPGADTHLCHWGWVILRVPGAAALCFEEEQRGKNESTPHLLSLGGFAAIACLIFGERKKEKVNSPKKQNKKLVDLVGTSSVSCGIHRLLKTN